MIDLNLFFRYLKGRCHGNQFCEKNDKLPTFIALHGTQKRNGILLPQCAHEQHNCASIGLPISCKNFLKFGPVTPELTELICKRQVRHGQKKLAYLV